MTNASLTLNEAIEQLQPYMQDEFLQRFRSYGLVLGYKNIARAIAKLAPKGKVRDREAEADYIAALEAHIVEAESFLEQFPRLPTLRTVSRFRKRTGVYGNGAKREMVDQLPVNEALAHQLKERGVIVEHDKRKGTWWADCEDEAWGQDVYLEEIFGGQAGNTGFTFDDVLPKARQAIAYKREIPELRAEIRRIERDGL